MLASGVNGTLYVGVTSDLPKRLHQHHESSNGFASKYRVCRLVRVEVFEDMASAIAREKQLKRWHRDWKMNLIERDNPQWEDLALGFGIADAFPGRAVDAETSSA